MLSCNGSRRRTHIQTNATCLQADDQHLWLPRRCFELRYCHSPFLDIHRTIEPILIKIFPLKSQLDQVQEARELRKNDRAKTRVLVSEPAYIAF